MTLLLAGATEQMAFVAADTRLNLRSKTGDVDFHDEGELPLSLNGVPISMGSTQRKIQDLRFGWIGGAGNYPFVRLVLNSLRSTGASDLEAVCDTIRRTWDEWAARLRDLSPPEDGIFFLIREDEGSFRLHQIEPNATEADVGENNFLASWPEDVPDPLTLQDDFLRLFRPPSTRAELCASLRSLAFAFDRVAELSALVSPRMEVGLLTREPGGVRLAHLAAPAKFVRQAGDDEVFELLSFD